MAFGWSASKDPPTEQVLLGLVLALFYIFMYGKEIWIYHKTGQALIVPLLLIVEFNGTREGHTERIQASGFSHIFLGPPPRI